MGDDLRRSVERAVEIVKAAAKEFGLDRASRMAAAIAYRTMFALAPLLLVGISILGKVLGGNDAARDRILAEVAVFAGREIREALEIFLANARVSGDTAALLGLGLLVWTASSLFLELQLDLNDIFKVPQDQRTGWKAMAVKRGLGFVWVVGFGIILIVVWGVNVAWQFLESLVPGMLEPVRVLISLLAPIVSLLVLPLLLGLAYQTLSKVTVRWRAVWWGSFLASVLFLSGAYAIGLYFRWTSEPNAVNVAGSIFVVLLLAFVLSAVFLFGAEVIKVYDDYLAMGDIKSPTVREAEAARVDVVVAPPPRGKAASTLVAFLGGLFVGSRRSKR